MKLFLKAHRCASPKCASVKHPYPPGMHGRSRRGLRSEYGTQLLEKQRVKAIYGIKERHLVKLLKGFLNKPGDISEKIISVLERQLSNVVFRLSFSPSRPVSRQLISHGHFLVNNKKVTIPSYSVKPGDVISIKPSSRGLLIFHDLQNTIKKYEPPSWLALDKDKLEGTVKSLPHGIEMPFDVNLVVDYYSK